MVHSTEDRVQQYSSSTAARHGARVSWRTVSMLFCRVLAFSASSMCCFCCVQVADLNALAELGKVYQDSLALSAQLRNLSSFRLQQDKVLGRGSLAVVQEGEQHLLFICLSVDFAQVFHPSSLCFFHLLTAILLVSNTHHLVL